MCHVLYLVQLIELNFAVVDVEAGSDVTCDKDNISVSEVNGGVIGKLIINGKKTI